MTVLPGLSAITVFGEQATPGRGGIIAVLFVAIFAAWLEKRLRKVIPVALDLFVTPTLVLLISGFLAIFIVWIQSHFWQLLSHCCLWAFYRV